MIVVDAAALTDALAIQGGRGEWARARLARDSAWCAPDYLIAEVFSAIRGLRLGGHIEADQAAAALDALGRVEVDLLPTRHLLWRMEELSAPVGAYDSGYVALAEFREVPLVTTDGRLARGAAHLIRIESP